MGLWQRDYMREGATEAEARGETPWWLRSGSTGRRVCGGGIWAVAVAIVLYVVQARWHLLQGAPLPHRGGEP
jgi:hypothetical protein